MAANVTIASRLGGETASSEPRWPAVVAALVAMLLWELLPSRLISGGYGTTAIRIAVATLALALIVPLAVAAPHRHVSESGRRRRASISVTAIVSFVNVVALGLLVHYLLFAGPQVRGRELLLAAVQIWWTNVILFALWYWELDGGGPPARMRDLRAPRDFAFVQMTDPEVSRPHWRPRFSDYFYCSFTNSSAFSPTDTMPLTRIAKQLMLAESTVSLLTLLLVAARAVNVLS
jgi:uncharacterized membrane protein